MDSLVDDNFSEIRKTFTDPLYNAMGLHVDMGASFHDYGTRDDYGIGCCATLDGVTHYAKAWPIEDHDSRWGACMGSFTFDESLAGNGVDYVSPDSLAKIMGDYGYHDSRSFLDCNLDVWSDELVGILGYEAFGSSQSEALVLSPLADKESVLQLFYTFSEKADGLISDELFNTLYWEMEAEERFAHARPIEAVDIDFDRARDIASSCLHRQIELKDDISFRLPLDILPKLNWDGPSIAIDALNYLADTQEFGIEALRSHATELFGSCQASVALDQAGYIIYSYSEPDAVTKMDDIFYPSIYSLPDSGDLIGSCIDALYDPYIPEVEEAMKDVRERRKNPMARYGSTPLDAVNVTVTPALIFFKNDPSVSQRVYFCDKCSSDLNIGEKIFSCGYTADELRGMIGKKTDENFVVVAVDDPFKVRATYLNLTQKIPSPAEIAASAKKAAGAKVSAGVDGGGKHI